MSDRRNYEGLDPQKHPNGTRFIGRPQFSSIFREFTVREWAPSGKFAYIVGLGWTDVLPWVHEVLPPRATPIAPPSDRP